MDDTLLALLPYFFISQRNITFESFSFYKCFTDTPFLTSSEMEGVREVSPALGHDKPVSDGCPLYNEASAFGDRLVVSSNVVQRLD